MTREPIFGSRGTIYQNYLIVERIDIFHPSMARQDRPRPNDGLLPWAAALLGAAPFLLTAPFCGLYLDDYSFLRMLEGVSPNGLWSAFIRYVPGRNLHIPFFYGLLRLTGGSVAAMHLVGLSFDALNAVLFFLLARRLTGLRSVALAAAAVFAVAPNHGETHFWINNIPQCQVPVALILTSLLLAEKRRLFPACLVYAAALFTYDQVFFLWPAVLAVSWIRESSPGRARYAGAAVGLVALNGAHIALRYLSPYSDGGRPLIRWFDFFHRCLDAASAVRTGILPWPTSSHAPWAWSVPVVALSMAGAAWLHRTVRARARLEEETLAGWTRESGWLTVAAGGAAWTVLSYLPNLFWYLSPRHNLIPSLGWSMTVVALGAYAVSRSRRAAAALPWVAGIFFAAAAVSDVHEGTQWVDSRRLHDKFDAAVLRLAPPVDSVFVVGAPRTLRRAPAFNLPHDVAMSAGRALGRNLNDRGDYQATPTLRGIVFANDLTLLPAASFRWMPAAEANLLSYEATKQSFTCAASFRVRMPNGAYRVLPLRSNPDCAAIIETEADAALLVSAPGARAEGRPIAGPFAGLSLLRAEATVRGTATVIELEWRVEIPPTKVLAFIPRLKDASNRLILDTVFPARNTSRPYPVIWPLVDDLAAGLPLRAGGTLRQTFNINREAQPLAPGGRMELDVFEIAPAGNALLHGTIDVPLAIKR